jgi:hypothetical protein
MYRSKNVLVTITSLSLLTLSIACSKGSTAMSVIDPRFDSHGDSVKFVQDGVSVQSADVSTMASGLQVSLGLTINPPATTLTGGTQVYASDLRVYGTRVMTAYNVPGNTQRGWVDYIDVTTLAIPLVLGSKYFADTDINSLAMGSNGSLALVGAQENVGAVLRTGTYNLLGFSVGDTVTNLTSYAGTGAVYDSTGTKLAVTSGDTGGIALMNSSTLASIQSYTLSDSRGITFHTPTNKFYAVKGQTGEVHSFDINGNHLAMTSIGGATIAQSKSTITAGTNFLLATKGDGGFSVICASDMQVAATQAQYIYPNYAAAGLPGPTLTVSNAAAFGPGMIFVAAGQAGVRVYNFTKASGTSPTACQNVQVSYMGYFEFGNTLSANNLVYANILTTALTYTGVLYVADGAGGFKAVTVVATRSSLNDIIDF